jgi:hypothetical protein
MNDNKQQEDAGSYLGKETFFLYPDTLTEKVIFSLFANEYEIYALYNYNDLKKVLNIYKNPLLFIEINELLKQPESQDIINDLLQNQDMENINKYIIYKELDEKSINYYLECGIRSCIKNTNDDNFINQLKIILDMNYVLGRRKSLRLICEAEIKFNTIIDGIVRYGKIYSISSTAVLCSFKDLSLNIKNGTDIHDIELILNDIHIHLNGNVFRGIESFNENLYVILFKNNRMETINEIKTYIYKSFQDNMRKKIINLG